MLKTKYLIISNHWLKNNTVTWNQLSWTNELKYLLKNRPAVLLMQVNHRHTVLYEMVGPKHPWTVAAMRHAWFITILNYRSRAPWLVQKDLKLQSVTASWFVQIAYKRRPPSASLTMSKTTLNYYRIIRQFTSKMTLNYCPLVFQLVSAMTLI